MFYLTRFWRFLTLAHEGGFIARWKTLRWYSRALILLSVVYAFTPVAWMDNWIPIIGELDELAVYSLLLSLALKLSPLPKGTIPGSVNGTPIVQHAKSTPKNPTAFTADARPSHHEG